jgi:hypothetical protein
MIKYLHHSELEGLTYALEDQPDGYHLFEHRKGGKNAPKRRNYLYGKYSAPLLSRFTTKIMIPYVQVRNIGFARSPNSSHTLFGYSTILLSHANVPIAPKNPRSINGFTSDAPPENEVRFVRENNHGQTRETE